MVLVGAVVDTGIKVSVAANAFEDPAGNDSEASTAATSGSDTITVTTAPVDTTKPVVTITVTPSSGTAASKSYRATDDDSGTTTWKVARTASSTCLASPPSTARNYTEGAAEVADRELYNNAYLCFWSTDAANNTGVNNIQITGIVASSGGGGGDTTKPTVTSITARPSSVQTNVATTVTFVFSEAVTGFTASDVTVTAANLG